MASQKFTIDVCSHTDPAEQKKLVIASKAFWTSAEKGYQLLSEHTGFVRVFVSAINDNVYEQGASKVSKNGAVTLVYGKQET